MELQLPFPPSVNEMYVNRKGRGRGRFPSRSYKQWTQDSVAMLRLQQHILQHLTMRVSVEILLDDRRQGDCDNRIKPVLDLLVKHRILRGDQKKYVRKVSSEWAACEGCLVRIVEMR